MKDFSGLVDYYGFNEWRFNIYRDGERIFTSKPFDSESECKRESQLWISGH